MSVTNKIFDTNVQLVKYKVLKEVIKHAFAGDLESARIDIAKDIAAGNKEVCDVVAAWMKELA